MSQTKTTPLQALEIALRFNGHPPRTIKRKKRFVSKASHDMMRFKMEKTRRLTQRLIA